MSVKAKFVVKRITQHAGNGQGEVAVTEVAMEAAHGPGNEEWSKFTPSGELRIGITNPAASEQFKPGQHVLVTFEAG